MGAAKGGGRASRRRPIPDTAKGRRQLGQDSGTQARVTVGRVDTEGRARIARDGRAGVRACLLACLLAVRCVGDAAVLARLVGGGWGAASWFWVFGLDALFWRHAGRMVQPLGAGQVPTWLPHLPGQPQFFLARHLFRDRSAPPNGFGENFM